jgi:phage shock protein C
MANDQKCCCARCRCHGLMGPVVLITLGILFFISEYSRINFGQLWPILLIAIGAVKVAEAMASTDGHHSGAFPGPGPGPAPGPGPGANPNPPLG